jgi:dihydrolipoamide dehydrogenase
MTNYDAVVIGAGPGGYVSAIRLAQLGFKTLLVEKHELGGECTNYGCIPSKLLIDYSNKIFAIKELVSQGLVSGSVGPSILQLWDKKEKVIKRLREGIQQLLQINGVDLVKGVGRVVDAGKVSVMTDTTEKIINARNIVLAIGSEPAMLKNLPFDGRRIISFKEALSLQSIPRRLMIVGGGAIGLELGTAYANLGSEIILVEVLDQLLPSFDRDISSVLKRSLESRGFKIYLTTSVEEYSYSNDGVKVKLTNGEEHLVDYVLVAVGKAPPAEAQSLENLGIKLTPKGFIKVDDKLRTSLDGVFAIGDATGPPFLAHRASAQGIICAENIASHEIRFEEGLVPTGLFTEPEVAMIGLSETEANKNGINVNVLKIPYMVIGKGSIDAKRNAFIKVIHDNSGKILGIQIIGPFATELINQASILLTTGVTVEELSKTIFVHPTYSEIFGEMLRAISGKGIHYAKFK